VPHLLDKPAVAAIALLLCACDEPSSPPISDPVPPITATSDPDEPPVPASTTETPVEPEPTPPPEPVGGPHCDQPATDKSARMCIDYSEHTGSVPPRCFAGVSLSDGPCPSEGVIGKCKLPSTGVTLVYYEGRTTEAAVKDCETIDGMFAPG
jgi:hypothetical protein